jgi:hypothetical protein
VGLTAIFNVGRTHIGSNKMPIRKITALDALGALAVLALGVGLAPKAEAGYIAYLYQDGGNVIATGSGSLDISGLSFSGTGPQTPGIIAVSAYFALDTAKIAENFYHDLSGPVSFGVGGFTSASTTTGSGVLIEGGTADGVLAVPVGYVSGTPLGTSTDIFDSTTLAALGVTDGTYTWTWGNGASADSLTLNVGSAPVAEPASLALLATGLVGLGMWRRRAT